MISTYRKMLAVCTLALLSLVSVSHSASLDCKDVLQPPKSLDPRDYEGRWTMVAGSIKSVNPVVTSKSLVIDFNNSAFSRGNLFGSNCQYDSHNLTLEGKNYKTEERQTFNISGSIFYTSCPDCMVLSFNFESPDLKSDELILFSKRREVEQKELQEFIAQVKCLNMPEPHVFDPNEELCPL